MIKNFLYSYKQGLFLELFSAWFIWNISNIPFFFVKTTGILWFYFSLYMILYYFILLLRISFLSPLSSNHIFPMKINNSFLEMFLLSMFSFLLLFLLYSSFIYLYYLDSMSSSTSDSNCILLISGNQWYWHYEMTYYMSI